MKFEDWFYELENFTIRAEWFHEDLAHYQGDNPETIIKWLRAAYDSGREHEAMKHWDDGK